MEVLHALEEIRFFGNRLIDVRDVVELGFRFLVNLVFASLIIRGVYYPIYRSKEYVFTYYSFNVTVFLVCMLLGSLKLSMGFAFGLFALFSILRYRTETVPIKEMTYLFIVITVAVVNALAKRNVSHAELFFTDIALVGVVYALERIFFLGSEGSKQVIYERIELVKAGNYEQMLADLRERTGLDVTRAEVLNIDFMRDTALLKVSYRQVRKKG